MKSPILFERKIAQTVRCFGDTIRMDCESKEKRKRFWEVSELCAIFDFFQYFIENLVVSCKIFRFNLWDLSETSTVSIIVAFLLWISMSATDFFLTDVLSSSILHWICSYFNYSRLCPTSQATNSLRVNLSGKFVTFSSHFIKPISHHKYK